MVKTWEKQLPTWMQKPISSNAGEKGGLPGSGKSMVKNWAQGARPSGERQVANWSLIIEDLPLSPGKCWLQIFQPDYTKYMARLSVL